MRFTKYWNQLKWLREILETLGDWDWMIVKYNPPRNPEQNRLYWALLTLVERETWNDREYLHEMMKTKFLSSRKLVKLWKSRKYVRKVESTSKLKRREFSEYFTKVEVFFSELWYHLPPMNSNEFQSLLSSCKDF